MMCSTTTLTTRVTFFFRLKTTSFKLNVHIHMYVLKQTSAFLHSFYLFALYFYEERSMFGFDFK